jgi:hypothetical protein
MAKRPKHQHDIKRATICEWPEGAPAPAEIAAKATYTGSAAHKTYPSSAGPPALKADKAKCDYYARKLVPTAGRLAASDYGALRWRIPRRISQPRVGLDKWNIA